MDQETKQLLEESVKLSRENNEMLNKLMRGKRLNTIYKIVYWSIIIAITVGSYYFIQPYLGTLTNLYSGGASNLESIGNIKDSLDSGQLNIDDYLKKLNN